jgi:DNA-binding transcriptional ArsR family regulator
MVNQTTEIFKALADDTRLSIVRKLAASDGSAPSCDLVASCAATLTLSQPAMSHHFSKLVAARVILEEKQGVQKRYRLNLDMLHSVGIDPHKI